MIDIKLVRKSVYATALELPKRVWDDHSKLVFEALDELERLQAKETPKKLVNKENRLICANCQSPLTKIDNPQLNEFSKNVTYCKHCGQKIDWSKESEEEKEK